MSSSLDDFPLPLCPRFSDNPSLYPEVLTSCSNGHLFDFPSRSGWQRIRVVFAKRNVRGEVDGEWTKLLDILSPLLGHAIPRKLPRLGVLTRTGTANPPHLYGHTVGNGPPPMPTIFPHSTRPLPEMAPSTAIGT